MPKSLHQNLQFRKQLVELGCGSKELAHAIWQMCARDLLFYINVFCWGYDSRKVGKGQHPVSPFITYEYQDTALRDVEDCIGSADLLVKKSRDMGVSWKVLLSFLHQWQFKELRTFLLVSKKEDDVDKTGDPDSLMWKLDFTLKNQPKWMVPNFDRQKLSMRNFDNQSTIQGCSTTGDIARGGRRTAIMLDEFASVDNGHAILTSTGQASACRIFVSTPKGTGNAFYDLTLKDNIKTLALHWTLHPEKSKGLYHDDKGKPRSPWYDLQCARAAHPIEIKQEIDMDFLGSTFVWFDHDALAEIEKKYVRPPSMVGDLDYETQPVKPIAFIPRVNGRFQFWTHIDLSGKPPQDRDYAIGCDIAQGTGASNSTMSIVDLKTGEKVGEFANPKIRPEEFAILAVATAKMFKGPNGEGAYMIWEASGPGRNFGDKVIECGYRNIFYRQNERSITKDISDVPGWWPTKENKMALLGEYRRALGTDFINRSAEAIKECREYVFSPDGGVVHAKAANTVDPSGARENHGDRVTADALVCKIIKERPASRKPASQAAPVSSIAFRRQKRQREAEQRSSY